MHRGIIKYTIYRIEILPNFLRIFGYTGFIQLFILNTYLAYVFLYLKNLTS